MILRHFRLDVELANCYVLGNEASREAVLVDAGQWRRETCEFLDRGGYRLSAILVTHSHHDHNGAVDEYVKQYRPPVVIGGSAACADEGVVVPGDGEELMVAGFRCRASLIGGHTADSMAYYFPDPGFVFTGDSVFAGSVGGTGSRADRERQVGNLASKVMTLPDHVWVFGGHGPASTVYVERHCNPFLREACGAVD